MKNILFAGCLALGVGQAAVIEFNAFSGLSSSVDGTLHGATVADQYGGSQYTSYVGHLSLMFADQSLVAEVLGTPGGTIRGDARRRRWRGAWSGGLLH